MSIISIAGGSQTFARASGGKNYVWNDINTNAKQVAPPNTNRVKIIFHNPGSGDLFIASAVANDPVTGASVPFNPTASGTFLGGCWRVFSNGGTLEITGECQGAWQAFAASGTGNPLTIMDSNI